MHDRVNLFIENVLSRYKKECRYLKKATFEYPKAYGDFFIDNTFYALAPSDHFTAIEYMICFNQLAWPCLEFMFNEKYLGNEINSFEQEYEDYQVSNSLITRLDRINFKRPIRGKQISGEIEICDTIPLGDKLHFKLSGKFYGEQGGLATGQVSLAYICPEERLRKLA